MDASTAVNVLVSVLLMGVAFYLRRVDVELKSLRDQLTEWREEMLRDCIQRREFDRHLDDLGKWKSEYVSKRFHDLSNEVHEIKMGRRPR